MARNPSPTTELSVTFESLRLESEGGGEEKEEEASPNFNGEGEEFSWRQNPSRADQSNDSVAASLTCTNYNEGVDSNNYIPQLTTTSPLSTTNYDCTTDEGTEQWRHHLLNYTANNHHQTQTVSSSLSPPSLPQRSCDCHMTPGGSHDHYCTINTPPLYQAPMSSCRQEALVYTNNDVSVDELAGYFDELLHLPKPMSVMAELMYT